MSDVSPILVLQIKYVSNPTDMAKVAIKSEKLTPFGGIFSKMDEPLEKVAQFSISIPIP